MNPYGLSKSIIVRNAKSKTLAVSKWLGENFNVQVKYSHCPSQQNCADLATKPVNSSFREIIDSKIWRKGHSSGLLSAAVNEDVFITVEKGEIKWHTSQVLTCPCVLSGEFESNIHLEDTFYDLISDIPFQPTRDNSEDGLITLSLIHI